MHNAISRRAFLKAAPAAAWMLARAGKSSALQPAASSARIRMEPFDYHRVRLHESRWQQQYQLARDFYLNIPDDDILCGYRSAAGLAAPGKTLGGWCQRNSNTVFGQWLSGMARMFRATDDQAMRDKAVRLMSEWAKTVKPDGDCGLRHYPFDKMVCGLVDMQLYAGNQDAIPLLEKITDWASKTLSRENMLANPSQNQGYYGRPQEWYTLSENLYRAYQLTGNPKFKAFAEVWLYHAYWNKFAHTAAPADAHGVHAYSHVNSFSSAAMAYAVTGDPGHLRIITNAYDYLQNTQCYATGGYGPNERFMAPDGSLGRALEIRTDQFETGCGSWAGFKLSRYLMQFTGEAKYGDWIERLLYNGVGAGLPVTTGGKNFYFSDYRLSGGMKVYNWEMYTCCSGTYIQDVVDYHNLIYFKDQTGLYVNLYVPSEIVWTRTEGDVRVTQDTRYPEAETSTLTVDLKKSMTFSLKFRVPGWSREVLIKVNGEPANVMCTPGTWAVLTRTWHSGDRVEIQIPLAMRMQAVDPQHPYWVAVVRGPVVLVLDGIHHDPAFQLPASDGELNKWIVPDDKPNLFRVERPDGRPVRLKFRPFYAAEEVYPYYMYFDLKAWPINLW
jgi:DUF1680 family protein